MELNELLRGESDNIEYKRERPKDSKKYLKTVVAFANGTGGTIVFGVDDKTHAAVGIPNNQVASEIDAITNAISDSCEPRIIPEIGFQDVEGKTLIFVNVAAGMQRPYFIKSMGMQDGTFIRVAGTSRQVEDHTLKELMLEGSGKSFDGIILKDQVVSEDEVEALCTEMTAYARSRSLSEEDKARIRPLTKNQLISWGLLFEEKDKLLPTYGYNLLIGKPIFQIMSGIQCAVFKGKDRAIFVDQKFYDGSLYKQIDDAYEFVLRMIRMGAVIDGVVRKDVYELPLGTIREAISNAVCHRSYFQPSYVQVALYDDRLEVTSPGMLSRDVTIERMKQGFSKIRNRGIAYTFSYMRIIEGWGSGIPRMFKDCKDYGLREPELIAEGGDFRINFYRNNPISAVTQEEHSKVPKSAEECRTMPNGAELPVQQQKVLDMLKQEAQITSAEVEKLLGVKSRRARAILNEMAKNGLIRKIGVTSDTYYVLP